MSGPNAGAAFEFDARVGITGALNVTGWADQSGNGRNLGLYSGTPQTGVRTIGGQNAIYFDGSATDEALWRNTVVLAQPLHIFMVVQSDQTLTGTTLSNCFYASASSAGIRGPNWYFEGGSVLFGGTVDTSPHILEFVLNSTTSEFLVDGQQVATGDAGTGGTSYILFGSDGGASPWVGTMAHIFGFPSVLSASERQAQREFLASQWFTDTQITGVNPAFWGPQGFKVRREVPFQLRGAEAAQDVVTGTSSTTNADDTSAATGAFGPSGTLARTNANDTSVATGSTVTGSLARTNANDTSAATGGFGPSGTLARTNANDTSVATGGFGPSGTLARTNANDTSVATGSSTTGSLARTNANDTSVASGAAGGAAGTLARTNTNDTSSGAGGTGPTGALTATNANDTLAAVGAFGTDVVGTLATTNADDTLEAVGIGGEVTPPTVVESRPGGAANYAPSNETREYWERERQRISAESDLTAILADDEEVLVLM